MIAAKQNMTAGQVGMECRKSSAEVTPLFQGRVFQIVENFGDITLYYTQWYLTREEAYYATLDWLDLNMIANVEVLF